MKVEIFLSIILLIFIVIVLLSSYPLFFPLKEKASSLFLDFETKKIKTNITYSFKNESIGIEFHENTLSFGNFPLSLPIERLRRIVILKNNNDLKTKVKILCEGSICKFLNFTKDIILDEKEIKELEICAERSEKEGYYEGNITFLTIKPKNKFFEFLIWII